MEVENYFIDFKALYVQHAIMYLRGDLGWKKLEISQNYLNLVIPLD